MNHELGIIIRLFNIVDLATNPLIPSEEKSEFNDAKVVVAQSAECTSKSPSRFNSVDVGSNPGSDIRWLEKIPAAPSMNQTGSEKNYR